MRTLLLALVLVSTADAADLQQQLDAMARAHHGKVALYAKHLKTGATVALDADRPVPTASVIKLPIMVEAFAQAKSGKRSLADKIVLREVDKVPGSGILQFLRLGVQMTLEDAIVLMMTLSDNTATNLVIDQVGIPAVNARSSGRGQTNTYLYKKVYRKAEVPMPDDQKQFGLGKTTAREMAAVLESIERCDLGDAKLCSRMIEIMKNQQFRGMIARYLETADTTEVRSGVAAKLGELDDVKNEVALVYTDTGPIVISIFTWGNHDQRWMADNEAYLLIARMARTIVDAWAPKGVVSAATEKQERAGKPTTAVHGRISLLQPVRRLAKLPSLV
ncbi:MAG: class A beta-lactamase-related serine hydrolase [Acidobacteria bacterium]|nr:class A beta-lactamase-related serine hydrolase [Acidobacteriota bacterium]